MKKILAGIILATGVLGMSTTVFADDAASTSATTNGSLNITAGSISLDKVTDVTFESASVGGIYTNGYDKTSDGTATVSDFLGDGNDCSLSALTTGWTGSDSTTLNSNSTLIINDQDISNSAQQVTTGGAGVNTQKLSYELKIKEGTNVNAGSHTNTINWSLGNNPSTTNAG